MALTTEFNNKGKEGWITARDAIPDHQAQVDEEGRHRRQRDVEDLAAESVGRENGRIKRFRPATEAALRAAQVREGAADSRMATTTALLAAQQAWDNQLVTVAGVTMTNAERQTARKRVLDNSEHYYQWARQQGLVSGRDQWAQAMAANQRLYEIDQIARDNGGKLPQALKNEKDELDSQFGAILDPTYAQARKDQKKERDATAEQVGSTMTSSSNFAERNEAFNDLVGLPNNGKDTSARADTETQDFPSAPVLAQAWDAAQAATVPLDRKPEQAPAPADPVAAGSGLSF